jgi:mitochondrial chaperone BCS1
MGLDDTSLNALISALPEQCIAIMEDVDAAFTHGLTRDATGTELEDPHHRGRQRRGRPSSNDGPDDYQGQDRGGNSEAKDARITLSGLLNALDGVSAQEGRLLFATTNRYQSLDPALIRPGRMDVHVEFRLASQYQARELYKRFYLPDAPDEPTTDDERSNDSGYVTPTKDSSDSPASPISSKTIGIPDDPPPTYNGTTHSERAPKLSKKEIERLAEQFAARIPGREMSMASLQGYLMSYKTRPLQAVDDVDRWVEDQCEGRDAMRAAARAAVDKA